MRYEVICPRSELSVSPIAIGWSEDRDVTRFGPAKRQQYIIHYVIKGTGYFCGNKVSAGQGFLITPGLFEEYHSDESDPWTFLWVIAYGADMEKLFRMCVADEKSGIFDYDFVPHLERIMEHIAQNSGKVLGILEMQGLFYRLFAHHETKHGYEIRQNNSLVYLDYAVQMIEREYSRDIKVSEICEKLGVSEPYLFRIFKKCFGKSPKRYISDLRLSQCKMLLSETDLSVSEVGCAVGYEDVLAFSKFFSKETRMSPTLYRTKYLRKKG